MPEAYQDEESAQGGTSGSRTPQRTPTFTYSDNSSWDASGNTTPDGQRTPRPATSFRRLGRSESQARRDRRRAKREAQWKRVSYYVPVLDWLPQYSLRKLRGDVTAALTLTCLLVPQSISYATNLAGVLAVNGLLGAAIPPIVYSILGTCRQLSVGPEAALSLLIGQTIDQVLKEEAHRHGPVDPAEKVKIALAITTCITFFSGLVAFGLGIFRLGFLDAVLSKALLRGFITAVAAVIFIEQMIPMLGLQGPLHALPQHMAPTTAPQKLIFIIRNLYEAHTLSAIISVVALAILVLAKLFKHTLAARRGLKWLRYVPDVLAVVVVGTILAQAFDWPGAGVAILGDVSMGDVHVHFPFHTHKARTYAAACVGPSIVVGIVGFLDSLVGAKDCASRFNYPLSPNRELVALGACNICASLVAGTLPGFGSLMRSRLGSQTGAESQLSALLTGCFVLLVAFFLMPLLFFLPKPILGSIIMSVVFSILAEVPHDVHFFAKMHAWIDLSLMTLTFLLTIFVNVEVGILVSVTLSMILCIREAASMRVKILGRVSGTRDWFEPIEPDEEMMDEEIPGVLIVSFRDPALTFANAGALKERLRRLELYGAGRHHPSQPPKRGEASVVVFHMGEVEVIDAASLQVLREVVDTYVSRTVQIYWTQVRPKVRLRLAKAGILDATGDGSHVQPRIEDALDAFSSSMATITSL